MFDFLVTTKVVGCYFLGLIVLLILANTLVCKATKQGGAK